MDASKYQVINIINVHYFSLDLLSTYSLPNTRVKSFMFDSNYGDGIIIPIFQIKKLRLRVLSNLFKVTRACMVFEWAGF